MSAHGLAPIIAAVPHYGNPDDAPARLPIFSGIQYKLPTAAISELQPFRSDAAPHALEMLKPMDNLDLVRPKRLERADHHATEPMCANPTFATSRDTDQL